MKFISIIKPLRLTMATLVLLGIGALMTNVCAEENETEAPVLSAKQIEFFETSIRPILQNRCVECHGPKKTHGALRLDGHAAILEGGDSGPALVPFKPEESLLIDAVRRESYEMPPDEELPSAEVELLTEWIKQGAYWPATDNDASHTGPDFKSHWSFQPITDPAVPEVQNSDWPQNDIDRFILSSLEEHELEPSTPADLSTVLRRLKWDLVGLPLEFAEVERFRQMEENGDSRKSIINQYRDELLASPHYGERWGRHWLDLARYADTKGYVFFERPTFHNAFTYRDYVIQSFNEDKPYWQFVKEQLAADQLEDAPYDAQAALGFITVGPHFKNEVHDIMADRIDVVTRGFLGLTVGCARCHDHKYDPIPIEDYYSFYGIFRNSVEPLHLPFRAGEHIPENLQAQADEIKQAAITLEEHYLTQYRKVLETGRERLREYMQVAQSQRSGPDTTNFDVIVDGDDLSPQLLLIWKQYLEDTEQQQDPVFVPWHRLARLTTEEFPEQASHVLNELVEQQKTEPGSTNQLLLDRLQASPLTGFEAVIDVYMQVLNEVGGKPAEQLTAEEQAVNQIIAGADSPLRTPYHGFKLLRLFPDRKSQAKVNELNNAMDAVRAKAPTELAQMLVVNDAEQIIEPRVLKRGNAAMPGDIVTRQYLRFFGDVSNAPFNSGSGRRELAEAIVATNNPLTARVIVNRVWQHHFGEGLVRTPSDFGMQSSPPTHPELLDHLATWFVREGGSIKKLHRYILASSTWQQSSTSHEMGEQVDPENKLLWRMNRRRLDFETMRDALLAVSGRLDLTVGGPSVNGIMEENNKRRTMYTHINRQDLPSVMRMFDFPPPDVSSGSRDKTTVPGQALFLMNHPLVLASAAGLSNMATSSENMEAGVHTLFENILHRKPTADEITDMQAFLNSELQEHEQPLEIVKSPWQYGYGAYDEANSLLTSFTPLPHWTGDQLQGGTNLPDSKLGWVYLNSTGGHPGNNLQHVAVVRWTAPKAMTVSINGLFKHTLTPGDGVRGRIHVGGKQIAGPWVIHQSEVRTDVETVSLKEGESLDFVVDILKELNNDMFEWSPVITEIPAQLAAVEGAQPNVTEKPTPTTWNYTEEFHDPNGPTRISPWQSLAQILLLSNEFQFVD
ncbi:Planctomycete cytochrome C [Polystyrenella longa]|uniref:Planctomycete cytochrome C n=1 Tax=Polystyrenella longa TaxID=2528007 RepID=A0A518CJV7_9PLAN|nr:PSD1 and planctomycete cytochrome C domain-containing protein [Polystyrenella longa]QDU79516.1 Planctomycete cytochrome C [Polystyrenella longa]